MRFDIIHVNFKVFQLTLNVPKNEISNLDKIIRIILLLYLESDKFESKILNTFDTLRKQIIINWFILLQVSYQGKEEKKRQEKREKKEREEEEERLKPFMTWVKYTLPVRSLGVVRQKVGFGSFYFCLKVSLPFIGSKILQIQVCSYVTMSACLSVT